MRLHATFSITVLASIASAQTILPPFNTNYSYVDLGTINGVQPNFGGLTFKYNDPNTLLICSSANTSSGLLMAVPVTRDASNHVNGFGTPVQVSTAPNNDGGLAYGGNNVLFFTQYPINGLGQIKPTSSAPDKLITLTPFGVNSSVGACSFVPSGYPAAGRFKVASYSSGGWYDVVLAPDTLGTYDVVSATAGINVGGGPEGILYPPANSPGLTNYGHVLVNEYGSGNVTLWNIDANGDPLTGTRQVFMSGIAGCEGAALDPLTNDFLFSTYGGNNRVIQVRGFGACGTFTLYGQGGPGTNGRIPTIAGTGCPRIAGSIGVQIGNGLPNTFGALALGFNQLNLPFLNFHIYQDLAATLPHALNGSGQYSYAIQIPSGVQWGNLNVYWQAGYLDSGAPQGFSATQGMQMFIR